MQPININQPDATSCAIGRSGNEALQGVQRRVGNLLVRRLQNLRSFLERRDPLELAVVPARSARKQPTTPRVLVWYMSEVGINTVRTRMHVQQP